MISVPTSILRFLKWNLRRSPTATGNRHQRQGVHLKIAKPTVNTSEKLVLVSQEMKSQQFLSQSSLFALPGDLLPLIFSFLTPKELCCLDSTTLNHTDRVAFCGCLPPTTLDRWAKPLQTSKYLSSPIFHASAQLLKLFLDVVNLCILSS
jgi:hypothetical protein